MPYNYNVDLPASVKEHLPEGAQDIYRKAFNAAYHEYSDPAKRRDQSESLDAVAARVAWAAVKKEYEKGADGKWHKKK